MKMPSDDIKKIYDASTAEDVYRQYMVGAREYFLSRRYKEALNTLHWAAEYCTRQKDTEKWKLMRTFADLCWFFVKSHQEHPACDRFKYKVPEMLI